MQTSLIGSHEKSGVLRSCHMCTLGPEEAALDFSKLAQGGHVSPSDRSSPEQTEFLLSSPTLSLTERPYKRRH